MVHTTTACLLNIQIVSTMVLNLIAVGATDLYLNCGWSDWYWFICYCLFLAERQSIWSWMLSSFYFHFDTRIERNNDIYFPALPNFKMKCKLSKPFLMCNKSISINNICPLTSQNLTKKQKPTYKLIKVVFCISTNVC